MLDNQCFLVICFGIFICSTRKAEEINNRLKSWNMYYEYSPLKDKIDLPVIPEGCIHNAHMFYINVKI